MRAEVIVFAVREMQMKPGPFRTCIMGRLESVNGTKLSAEIGLSRQTDKFLILLFLDILFISHTNFSFSHEYSPTISFTWTLLQEKLHRLQRAQC